MNGYVIPDVVDDSKQQASQSILYGPHYPSDLSEEELTIDYCHLLLSSLRLTREL